MSKDLLKLEEVTKYYVSSGGIGLGLHKVNLTFNLGEFVVITGSSGSGKTTLLNVITGMDTYEEGTIFVEGEDTTYYGKADYEEFRRKYVSFIFQNYNLIESYTVYQNVELALIARGIPKRKRYKMVIEMLKQVGLKKRIHHRVTKLSGGEKQRVSIARALCSDAPIIACDEITGNLDMKTSIEIIELLKRLSKGKLVLLVSHDVNEAIDYATRVVVMHDGSVDKDYFTNNQGEEKEIHTIRQINDVSFKDTIRIGVRTLLSTPMKFFLLFIISLFFNLFLFAGATTYLYMEDVSISILEERTEADLTSYTNRIIVRKNDSGIMSDDEILAFKKIKNVSAVISDDVFYSTEIIYAFEDEVSVKLYTSHIQPSGILSFSDLLWGRLPRNGNEVVLVGERKFLNEKVYLAVDGLEKPLECKVVGLLPTSEKSAVYLHDDVIPSIVERCEMAARQIQFRVEPEDKLLASTARPYDWYVDESLADDEIRVETHTARGTADELVIKDYGFYPLDFYFTSNGTQFALDDMKLVYHMYTYALEENRYLTGKQEVLEMCDKTSRNNKNGSSINGYLSPANYEKLKEFYLQKYQITILVNNEKNVRSVVNEIEKNGYYCSAKALIQNEDLTLLATVLELVVVVAVLTISIGLALIIYIIIRNILNSQQKTFLIMRSLGIDGKRISIQIYIELAFALFINFIPTLIIWSVFKLRNFGGFFASIHKSNIGTVLLLFAFATLVFAILAFKYSSSVLKSSIVNKEME